MLPILALTDTRSHREVVDWLVEAKRLGLDDTYRLLERTVEHRRLS